MKYLLLLVYLAALSCGGEKLPSALQEQEVHEMYYIKDSRTNLCFAKYGWAYSEMVLVPCDSLKHIKIN